jgi:predicted nucleic acid-binding protein
LKTVSNTSPILNLSMIGEIRLVQELFGSVLIPKEGDDEFKRLQQSRSRFANVSVPPFVAVAPIKHVSVIQALKLQLHVGEAEAIAFAVEEGATRLL